jgi:hypothetical protein
MSFLLHNFPVAVFIENLAKIEVFRIRILGGFVEFELKMRFPVHPESGALTGLSHTE